MKIYDARRPYDAALTARDYSGLLRSVRQPPHEGVLWLILAPRRYGKTWTLQELKNQLGPPARYMNLGLPGDKRAWLSSGEPTPPGGCWLLDEPSSLIGVGNEATGLKAARDFLTRCEALRAAQVNVILALTPRELHQLHRADEDDRRISFKSILRLEPLTATEVLKLARTPEAQELLARLPPDWRRTPFLIELLLDVEEEARTGGAPLGGKLFKTVLESAERSAHLYSRQVFWDALTDGHRETLRAIVRNEAVDSGSCDLLKDAGLVGEEPSTGKRWIADPVLAARLSPVRIHHLSDIHVGHKAAESIDAKERGRLAKAVDPGKVRESYLSHLEGLHRDGKAPHALIISGDLTEWATPEQCKEAREWVDRLSKHLQPHVLLDDEAQRILLVGGNHDVNRSQMSSGGERARHETFARSFEGYAHPHLEKAPSDRELAVIEWLDLGITVLLLGTSELGSEVEKELEQYRLQQELAKLANADDSQEREKARKAATEAARIDPGLVQTQDLHRVSTYPWKEKLPVRIAVLHHPLATLPFTEVAPYTGLINAGAVKQVLMDKRFCLALCGHMHVGWFVEERWIKNSKGRTLRIATAPSLGSREIPEPNGFNLIEVFRERNASGEAEYQVRVRRYVREGDRGWEEPADQMGPFSPGS
jgi:3',5'-cyclic AMP phosphodiesterase CpdA